MNHPPMNAKDDIEKEKKTSKRKDYFALIVALNIKKMK